MQENEKELKDYVARKKNKKTKQDAVPSASASGSLSRKAMWWLDTCRG